MGVPTGENGKMQWRVYDLNQQFTDYQQPTQLYLILSNINCKIYTTFTHGDGT